AAFTASQARHSARSCRQAVKSPCTPPLRQALGATPTRSTPALMHAFWLSAARLPALLPTLFFASDNAEPSPLTATSVRQAATTSSAVVAPPFFIAALAQPLNSLTQVPKSWPERRASLSWHLLAGLV